LAAFPDLDQQAKLGVERWTWKSSLRNTARGSSPAADLTDNCCYVLREMFEGGKKR